MATPPDTTASGPIPLLNEYKHGLFRRRILQTLTGGLRLRKAPWYIHVIQFTLWIAPLLLCLPFIVLNTVGVWNPYYLAMVYGAVMGVAVLIMGFVGVYIRYRASPVTDIGSVNPQLDDEESIDFSSCFELETFDFVFSTKKLHSVALHPLVSGLLSFAGCFLLLPGVMQEEMHIGGVVVVFVFGWFTLCNAHYSLAIGAPHETATYRQIDPLELRFLMRPFYVLAAAVAFFLIRLLVSQPALYLHLLYVALCLLPLGWLLGLLPPLDALVPWIMEWGLTHLMGGSQMATDLRLVTMFTVSLISVVIVAVVPTHSIAIPLAAALGLVLSQDIFANLKTFGYMFTSRASCSVLQSLCVDIFSKTFASYHIFDFHPVSSCKSYLAGLAVSTVKAVPLLAGAVIIAHFTFSASGTDLARTIAASLVIALYCVVVISDSLQRIYILRFFRNPLHPRDADNVENYNKKRRIVNYLSIPRRLLLTYVVPLLMVVYVGLSLEVESIVVHHIWFRITSARVFRKIWQNTTAAHLELAVVAILHLALPSDSGWATLGVGTQIFIVGVTLDTAASFLHKLSFAFTLLVDFLSNKKQRSYFSLNIVIIIVSIVLLPLILGMFLLASILSAPLLPLFTLPIFLVSFPRTQRFWPSLIDYGSSYSKCEDSVYYKEAESQLVKAVSSSISNGAIHTQPGSHLLLRFQDRLVAVVILEVGFGFCTLSIRGLELQETSCHTVEATRIDDIFEMAYGHESKSWTEFWFNGHFLNTLQPVDTGVIQTYSDAHNVLTGIIDQPSALEHFSQNLLNSLVWVMFHYFSAHTKTRGRVEHEHRLHSPLHLFQRTNLDSGLAGSLSARKHPAWETSRDPNEVLSRPKQTSPLSSDRPHNPDTLSWSNSISSHSDNLEPTSPSRPGFFPDPLHSEFNTAFLPGLIAEDRPVDSHEMHHLGGVFSETTIDNDIAEVKLPVSGIFSAAQKNGRSSTVRTNKVHPEECGENRMPSRWIELPLNYSQINKLLNHFPHKWMNFIHEKSGKSAGLKEMEQQFMRLVMVCFSLVDIPCQNLLFGKTAQTKPFDVYKGFCGEIPYSSDLDWLTSGERLKSLVLKAYRYAVRLMYDEASFGEVDGPSELVEYLEHYDSECFIGCEDSPAWEESILSRKPHLFSIGRDPEKDVYTAHVLTLQDQVVHIGQLNSEGVHAIWADLAFELLYLTNDDEERYSIQAHPTLLRNLTIQIADPPLGYHVYSSGLVRVPSV